MSRPTNPPGKSLRETPHSGATLCNRCTRQPHTPTTRAAPVAIGVAIVGAAGCGLYRYFRSL